MIWTDLGDQDATRDAKKVRLAGLGPWSLEEGRVEARRGGEGGERAGRQGAWSGTKKDEDEDEGNDPGPCAVWQPLRDRGRALVCRAPKAIKPWHQGAGQRRLPNVMRGGSD